MRAFNPLLEKIRKPISTPQKAFPQKETNIPSRYALLILKPKRNRIKNFKIPMPALHIMAHKQIFVKNADVVLFFIDPQCC
jgi:hypothetical protein